ncbi:chemotaxis protein CheW [Nocardioides marmoriginsengisoli]|uniref:Chemotaxis protein CheW n=1 Tax=Nocardioides marmoriginsengisoli TaxID=661483 RepID=A0A3N0CCL9_9ACTN|nr:chemotaxis protein CheW [Nocardioides marmoriginsengisoli]RNL61049.1 chemotaxis protein CheW [Nocardioides marmoriginsengisoli]
MSESQYCTFWVDGLFFGVAVSSVQEVLRYQPLTVVPSAPGAIQGLINLRGQIVTAVDLRHRLGLPPRTDGALPMNVIVRSRGEVVSLLVDDIGDVITPDAAPHGGLDLEPAPANVPSVVQDVVSGVLALPDAILLVLDADRAADVSVAPLPTGGTP